MRQGGSCTGKLTSTRYDIRHRYFALAANARWIVSKKRSVSIWFRGVPVEARPSMACAGDDRRAANCGTHIFLCDGVVPQLIMLQVVLSLDVNGAYR